MANFYIVEAGSRKTLANPDAPKSGWVRSKRAAYRFRSLRRANRIASRMATKTGMDTFVVASSGEVESLHSR
jgi:hypothetical protein